METRKFAFSVPLAFDLWRIYPEFIFLFLKLWLIIILSSEMSSWLLSDQVENLEPFDFAAFSGRVRQRQLIDLTFSNSCIWY